jgi:hypothetical protein
MPTYDPDNYPHRNRAADASQRRIERLLKMLAELEAGSHPDKGELSANGKDLRAFEALRLSGELVDVVAGWAIDHQVGLALRGLAFVPLGPSGTKNHPEYLKARAVVDSHEHEHAARHISPQDIDGKFVPSPPIDQVMARRLLQNLLRANSGGFPFPMVNEAVRQLEGLDFGEQAPMFQPIETDAKAKLGEMRLQLEALCFVEYRVKKGLKKGKAVEEVASALGVADLTLTGWTSRLRQGLGRLTVAREISFAQNIASHFNAPNDKRAKYGEKIFGAHALKSLAARYKAAKGKRKAAKGKRKQEAAR